MMGWLKRNTMPIAIVLVAAAAVIGGAEVLDSLSASEPFEPKGGDGSLTVAGLIKVTMFMLVPGSLTLAVRRRQKTEDPSVI